MLDKKGFRGALITIMIVALLGMLVVLVKPPEKLSGHVIYEGMEQCEIDRTCCRDTILDSICIRSDTAASFSQPFRWKDLYMDDEDRADLWHYHGSYYHNGNVDGYPGQGGFGRVYYGSYGLLWNGPRIGSGYVDSRRWTPTKNQETGHLDSPFSGTYEDEITSDRYFIVSKVFVRCNSPDGCNTTQGDPIAFRIDGVNGGQGASWRSNIDGSYCGFEERYVKPTTPFEAALDRTFLFVVSPCPVSNDASQRRFLLNGQFNKTNEYTIVVTDKSHESGVSDWVENYYAKELAIRSEYEQFARAIKYPTGRSDAEKKAYYLTDYSNWFDTFSQFDDSQNANFRGKEIVTPNFNLYYGMWKWDSFWSAFSILGAVDTSSQYKDVRLNKVRDWINVWSYHTEGKTSKWPQNIRLGSVPANVEQNEGGWALAAWDLYKKDGNKAALCAFSDNLASDYEAYRATRGDNWRLHAMQLGRDGSDVSANLDPTGQGETVDSTSWFLLDALVNANIQKECGNAVKAEEYYSDFQKIKQDMQAFWNPTVGFYTNFNKNNDGFFYHSGDKASYAATPNVCWLLALDAVPTDKVNTVVNKLKTDFVDDIGLTSIPKTHKCYMPDGSANGCWAGATWDGPTWAGVDNTICIWALRQQVNVYGKSDLADELKYFEDLTLQVARQHPFGAESYDSDGTGVAAWGSNPYGWGALVGTNPITGYNPLSTLTFSMSGVLTAPQITTPSSSQVLYANSVDIAYSSVGASTYTVYGDNQPISGCSSTASKTCKWQGFSSGSHTIRVVASDGKTTKESTVSFTYTPTNYNIVHPTLLFSKSDIPTILSNIQTGPYKSRYDTLMGYASSAPSWSDSWTFDQVIWTKAFVPVNLGVAYQLTGNQAYLDKAKGYLLGFAKFTPQQYADGNIHAVLDTMWQLSIAYDLLYEGMTPSERQAVVDFLYKSCVTNAGIEDGSDYYYYYEHGNGHGLRQAFGMCALSIYGEHPTDPFLNSTGTDYFSKYYQSADNYLASYFSGSYANDGISYQDYGLVHTLSYVASYDRRYPDRKLFDKYEDTLCGIADYYTFAIWDTDRPYENDFIKRMDFSDMESAYAQTPPQVFSFIASKCKSSAAQWYLLFELNKTDNYVSYNNLQTTEDLIWFDKSVPAIHPKDNLPLSWKDRHDGLVIWRDGWTLTDDLVVTFKSDDEVGGHPHADDNSILLFYKEELLTDTGYKNQTNEIPGGECYHNTLVVDSMCDMRWQDRGKTNPTFTRQLFGRTQGGLFTPGSCSWPDGCHFMPEDFRGRIIRYAETPSYRSVQGSKPYYTLKGFTRHVVMLNTSPAIIVVKDRIASDINHTYDINFVSPYDNVVSQAEDEMLIQNYDSNLLIKTVYSSSPFSHNLKYKKYGKTYRGGKQYEWISSSSVRVAGATDLMMVNVLVPYLDSEAVPYTFTYTETANAVTVYVNSPKENHSVTFDKADAVEVIVESGASVSPPDPRFPRMGSFDGSTTAISDPDILGSLSGLVLEKTAYGKIAFKQPVSIISANLDQNVIMQDKYIMVNTNKVPGLNVPARITFYNVAYRNPAVLLNGKYCRDCKWTKMGNALDVNVSHFSAYSVTTMSSLGLKDTSDTSNVYANSPMKFTANYSWKSDSLPITGATCTANIKSVSYPMGYNPTSRLYEVNRSYSSGGSWSVTCAHAAEDTITLADSFTISAATCGNSVCEATDGTCPSDCSTAGSCGSLGNACQAGDICISGSCETPATQPETPKKSGGGGGGGGGGGSGGPPIKPSTPIVEAAGSAGPDAPQPENVTTVKKPEPVKAQNPRGNLSLLSAQVLQDELEPGIEEPVRVSFDEHGKLMMIVFLVTAAILGIYEFKHWQVNRSPRSILPTDHKRLAQKFLEIMKAEKVVLLSSLERRLGISPIIFTGLVKHFEKEGYVRIKVNKLIYLK